MKRKKPKAMNREDFLKKYQSLSPKKKAKPVLFRVGFQFKPLVTLDQLYFYIRGGKSDSEYKETTARILEVAPLIFKAIE